MAREIPPTPDRAKGEKVSPNADSVFGANKRRLVSMNASKALIK